MVRNDGDLVLLWGSIGVVVDIGVRVGCRRVLEDCRQELEDCKQELGYRLVVVQAVDDIEVDCKIALDQNRDRCNADRMNRHRNHCCGKQAQPVVVGTEVDIVVVGHSLEWGLVVVVQAEALANDLPEVGN